MRREKFKSESDFSGKIPLAYIAIAKVESLLSSRDIVRAPEGTIES
jgi:hypothetical protein